MYVEHISYSFYDGGYMQTGSIEEKMYQLAVDLIKKRYIKGWGGAAVVRTHQDHYYTSVALENANMSTSLCIEVGAMCEAYKYDEKITHCICVTRDDEVSPFKILSPCGICQERLRYWGGDVMVGVTNSQQRLLFVPLKDLQPYHWTKAYPYTELEHYESHK